VTDLLADVEQSIRAQRLLLRGASVLVAVSGGLDSMVLLHLLRRLGSKHRWKLIVAHFNHQLRGRSSDTDERFVRRIAAAFRLPFVAGRGSVKGHARRTGQSVEMAARDLRHAFLAQTARKLKCRTVALAHHADDQVELFFLRLLRGAGGDGLAGMKWQAASPADTRVRLVRPLLNVRRTDLASFARANEIGFREDASNASWDHRRNRIRHELLPLLESSYQPGLMKTVPRLMEIIRADAEFVTEAARRWLAAKRRPVFGSLPLALQRRCLRLQLERVGVAADYQIIEELRVNRDRPVSINPTESVYRDNAGRVHARTRKHSAFKPDELRVSLNEKAGEVIFDGVRCRWRVVVSRSLNRRPGARPREFFDADAVGSEIILRHWRPGDRFQPIGMEASVKLQDWFTNQKIPAARRREVVVAATARDEIFWIEGMRISERFKLTTSTRRRLIWAWRRA
jgi:tRNA(Ile)-lysidine synthase